MSNVSLDEILVLCAQEFNVSPDDIGRAMQTSSYSPNRVPPLIDARAAYLYLSRRHTTCTWRQIFHVMRNGSDKVSKWLVDSLPKFEQRLKSNATLAGHMDRIEDEIDDIHESRLPNKIGDAYAI